MTELLGEVLIGAAPAVRPEWTISIADHRADYDALRRDVFVHEQALFAGSDRDDVDDDPRTVVLVARARTGELLGGGRRMRGPGLGGRLRLGDDDRRRERDRQHHAQRDVARAGAEGDGRSEGLEALG